MRPPSRPTWHGSCESSGSATGSRPSSSPTRPAWLRRTRAPVTDPHEPIERPGAGAAGRGVGPPRPAGCRTEQAAASSAGPGYLSADGVARRRVVTGLVDRLEREALRGGGRLHDGVDVTEPRRGNSRVGQQQLSRDRNPVREHLVANLVLRRAVVGRQPDPHSELAPTEGKNRGNVRRGRRLGVRRRASCRRQRTGDHHSG